MNLTGIGASSGYGIGKAFIVKEFVPPTSRTIDDPVSEVKRFEDAVKQAHQELEQIYQDKKDNLGEENAAIFQAHITMLNDPELNAGVINKINKDKECAEYAAKLISDQYYEMFSAMDDDYFRERALDIKDIGMRLMKILTGVATGLNFDTSEPVIIVAKDLTPSDTASLKADFTAGIVTEIGGSTSHSAIIARTLGIPAVMGLKNATSLIETGSTLTIDGSKGLIVANPSEVELNEMKENIKMSDAEKELLKQYLNQASKTKDGVEIEISSNIASPDDLTYVIENGSDGVGLFRSEFIYMNRSDAPSEDEQYKIYKKVLEGLKGKPVVIRTLDAGGDKEIPYLDIPKEMNPFLGYRAIRYCLDHQDLFKAQIRALLRAGVHGKLRIMFPMISSLEELQAAKALVEVCKSELKNEGIPYDEKVELGIMIEIPSAAIISDVLAKEVDFFSIGTNDLIQYSVAVDRMNEQIKQLYSPYHPALVRLIKTVIDNGHKAGIWVGMCGAVAGNTKMIPLLLHLGLDEFSMGPTDVLRARQIINNLPRTNDKLVEQVLSASTSEKIEKILSK